MLKLIDDMPTPVRVFVAAWAFLAVFCFVLGGILSVRYKAKETRRHHVETSIMIAKPGNMPGFRFT